MLLVTVMLNDPSMTHRQCSYDFMVHSPVHGPLNVAKSHSHSIYVSISLLDCGNGVLWVIISNWVSKSSSEHNTFSESLRYSLTTLYDKCAFSPPDHFKAPPVLIPYLSCDRLMRQDFAWSSKLRVVDGHFIFLPFPYNSTNRCHLLTSLTKLLADGLVAHVSLLQIYHLDHDIL